MPLATVKTTKSAISQLRKQLEQQHRQSSERVAKDVQEEAERLLEKTLEFANSGSGAFADARPVVKYDIRTTNRGSQIDFNVYMGDESTSPHYVWHLLQFGIPARTQKNTSPPLDVISAPRTTPDRVSVEPYRGTGDTFVIPKGTQIKETPSRNWYEQVEIGLRDFVKAKYPDWKIESSQVNKP
jgi:hypothetical protein